jgi:hypothetical protein
VDVGRKGYWSPVTLNYQKKPKNVGENSTHYIPTTTNRFELMSNLTKDTDEYRPEKYTDKEPRNYSRCQQRKFVRKDTTFRGNYKTDIEIAKYTCMKHDSVINGKCRNNKPIQRIQNNFSFV